MTGLDSMTIFAGMQVILPKIEFESSIAEAGGGDGGNAGAVAAIPSFFMVKPLSEKTWFGLSAAAPLGGAFDFGSSWTGRYGELFCRKALARLCRAGRWSCWSFNTL